MSRKPDSIVDPDTEERLKASCDVGRGPDLPDLIKRIPQTRF